jgi:DHA1 family bicyclomycin/chloramphenicol resistance-like MFS transporter
MTRRVLPGGELVALTALLMSLVAMSIDSMLPALADIGRELGVTDANDNQLVVSAMFLGLAVAQMLFGPLSDAVGRRPAIFAGLGIFCAGSVICLVATSFPMILAGRVLQGAGAAGPRIIAVAVIRDQFEGRQMARIMSVVMAVFIIVPTVAPAVGQGVLVFADWRAIFAVLLGQAIISLVWFAVRQPETLAADRRMPLSARRIGAAIAETCTNRIGLGYTVAAGLVSGAFLGYLNSSQQIFVDLYDAGTSFPLYFGGLALAIGAAALLNSRLVERLGMRHLCWRALTTITGLSLGFLVVAWRCDGQPPLWALMVYLVPLFFSIGILFGNFNSMAIEPLGHIAGTAAAVIGSLTTFIGLGLGVPIGHLFDLTVFPLVAGFASLSAAALGVMWWVERGDPRDPSERS